MSHLITLDNVSHAFGNDVLLDHVKLQIASGERVCLIGRNGAGKSTLLKIIEGSLKPDDGSVFYKNNLRIAKLAQELPQKTNSTVLEFVTEGLAEIGELLSSYHTVAQRVSESHKKEDLNKLEQLQQWLYEYLSG